MEKLKILNFSKRNDTITRTIRISGKTFDKINDLAEKNNISFNSVINQIIEFGLENLEEEIKKIFTDAISEPDIVALSIATRPDCLGNNVLGLLEKLNKIKPVWVELGLQTIHEKSADYIRRM